VQANSSSTSNTGEGEELYDGESGKKPNGTEEQR